MIHRQLTHPTINFCSFSAEGVQLRVAKRFKFRMLIQRIDISVEVVLIMLARRSVLRDNDGILPDDVVECLKKMLRRDFARRIVKLGINLRSKQFRMIRNNAPTVVADIIELFFCLFKYRLILICFFILQCVFTREKG